ncbi:DUF5134 domain-containing protein [Streptomyces benahoarensis]|uniref:DUF5134 domain-containing protein n=1 Tax=Streptomyces benahoarensis TaxID=2595054 RepID=A0A553YQK5_9ACTN|nr:DUF5134 domain-containing protein [Streptomyces benahoarensis]TSB31508.1 DUF5134 domain-containing protein [Streptomyces benahoarensis]
MHGPSLTSWLLVVVCAAAGGYCLSRARHGTAAQRSQARGQALMGLAMAVMALPATVFAPAPWLPWVYAAVFTAAALRALWLRHAHHTVDSLAMVYMALAMTPLLAADPAMSGMAPMTMPGGHGGAMAGHAGHVGMGGPSLVTGALLVYYAGAVLLAGSRLIPGAGERGAVSADVRVMPSGEPVAVPAVAGAGPVDDVPLPGGAAVGLPEGSPAGPPEGATARLPEGAAAARSAVADPVLRRAEAFGACRLAMSLGMFVMLLSV